MLALVALQATWYLRQGVVDLAVDCLLLLAVGQWKAVT